MMGTNRPQQQQQRFPYNVQNQNNQGYHPGHGGGYTPQQQFNYNNNNGQQFPNVVSGPNRFPATGTGRPPTAPTQSRPSSTHSYYNNFQNQSQQQHQQMYAPPPPPPRPPRPPGMLNFIPGEILNLNSSLAPPGTTTTTPAAVQQPPLPPKSHSNSSVLPPGTESEGQRRPLPPPPPPPQISKSKSVDNSASSFAGGPPYTISGGFPPLAPPPLPPMFPYMSVELAQSLEQGASQCGQSFEKEKSDLPFVPVIINDDDLRKMTEIVKTQTEESKSMQDKLFYKDIIDPNMPQALKEMLQPLYCKLCKLTLSSPVVARDHYKGKRHKKAEDVWLQEHAKNNKSQMNKRGASVINGTIRVASSNNNDQFNSRRPGPSGGNFRPERPSFSLNNSSQQSSVGANYNNGFSRPSFDNQRKRPAEVQEPPTEFIPAYRAALANPNNPKKKRIRKEGGTGSTGGPNFAYCDLCSISLTSQAHADQHFNGKNHKQKMLSSTRNGEFGGDPRFGIGTDFGSK